MRPTQYLNVYIIFTLVARHQVCCVALKHEVRTFNNCSWRKRLAVVRVVIDPDVFPNRLSDFLFTAARYAAMSEGKVETIYKPVHTEQEHK